MSGLLRAHYRTHQLVASVSLHGVSKPISRLTEHEEWDCPEEYCSFTSFSLASLRNHVARHRAAPASDAPAPNIVPRRKLGTLRQACLRGTELGIPAQAGRVQIGVGLPTQGAHRSGRELRLEERELLWHDVSSAYGAFLYMLTVLSSAGHATRCRYEPPLSRKSGARPRCFDATRAVGLHFPTARLFMCIVQSIRYKQMSLCQTAAALFFTARVKMQTGSVRSMDAPTRRSPFFACGPTARPAQETETKKRSRGATHCRGCRVRHSRRVCFRPT